MGRWVDLHLHSSCSDGIHPPAKVVRLAAEEGLAAIALCDHDHVGGVEPAMEAGRQLGVEVISGVELSVLWKEHRDLHLLGYGFDHHRPELLEALEAFRDFRRDRNRRILERINDLLRRRGEESIPFAEVEAAAGGTVGRPHIAMALVARGLAAGTEDAFDRFLVPYNVPKRYFPVDEAMGLIHRAGGVAVLAHPPFIPGGRRAIKALLDALVPLGLEGIEAYNSGATEQDVAWAVHQAAARGLIVTGGSDFHGIEDGSVRIGRARGNLRIPYACAEAIRERLRRREAGVSAAGRG